VTGLLVLLQMLMILAALSRLIASSVHLPVFGAYLVFNLAMGAASWWASGATSTNLAVWIWAYGQFVTAAFWVAAADELRRRILVQYVNIGRFGLLIVFFAIAASVLIVWITATEQHASFPRLVTFVPRIVASILAVAVGMLAVFVSRYPADQAPNSLIHGQILGFYFGAQGLSFLAVNVGVAPQTTALVGMVLSMTAYLLWTIRLSAAGEAVPTPAANPKSITLQEAQQRSEDAIAELRDLL
jgi:hypothetical protein